MTRQQYGLDLFKMLNIPYCTPWIWISCLHKMTCSSCTGRTHKLITALHAMSNCSSSSLQNVSDFCSKTTQQRLIYPTGIHCGVCKTNHQKFGFVGIEKIQQQLNRAHLHIIIKIIQSQLLTLQESSMAVPMLIVDCAALHRLNSLLTHTVQDPSSCHSPPPPCKHMAHPYTHGGVHSSSSTQFVPCCPHQPTAAPLIRLKEIAMDLLINNRKVSYHHPPAIWLHHQTS